LPAELAEERAWHDRSDYRHRLILDAEDPINIVNGDRAVTRSRGVWQRQIFCWIAFPPVARGALNLWQFYALPDTNDHDFFEAMDA
jgi:hypothetical protein